MNLHAIIAGTNKAGTTSLFRYLSGHPDICASRIKETNFFIRNRNLPDHELLTKYESFFPHCKEDKHILLEASPAYLQKGGQVAMHIQKIHPGVKLIFLLREPVSRLLSYFYRNKQTQDHIGLAKLELDEFVDIFERVSQSKEVGGIKGPRKNALIQFQRGCYSRYLLEYLKYVNVDDICIVFFDDLVKDTRSCVQAVSRFLGINPDFYEDYQFTIENKTQRFKYDFLQIIGSRLNMKFEPLLNRYPSLRHILKKSLLTKNGKSYKRNVSETLLQRIQKIYEPENRKLSDLIKEHYPEMNLPQWLQFHDNQA